MFVVSLFYAVLFHFQTCVKYCTQAERDTVFDELKPHFLTFATNKYAIHLVMKMLDNGTF
jgi:pumilio family protein 6